MRKTDESRRGAIEVTENLMNMETTLPLDADRPTRAEIRLGALARNFARVRSIVGSGVDIMPCVKANAYGHGILRVSEEFVKAGAKRLGVAFIEEGMHLRKNGIRADILALGAISTTQIPKFLDYDIEMAVPSVEKAEAISAEALKRGTKAKVHLKIDTGMERIGVHWYSVEPFIEKVFSLGGLDIIGVFSHFAKADDDIEFSLEQVRRFETVLELLEKKGKKPPIVHMSNSAGIVNIPSARCTMVRPGLMLYGYEPTPLANTGVEPVMRLMSKVSYFKVVKKGAGVSYGHTFTAKRDTRIVTIPVGYGDGYPRLLSNKGEVVIRHKTFPVVGNVCMDQMMADLGPVGEAYNGDDVLIFGTLGADSVSVESLCEKTGLIPYEMTCAVSSRVPRIYVDD